MNQFFTVFLIIFAQITFAANPTTSGGKSLEGYETLDMENYKDLNTAVSNCGAKFQANCTTMSGELVRSTDSRFTDCMNQTVHESRMRKGSDKQEAQNLFPNQEPGVKFETGN